MHTEDYFSKNPMRPVKALIFFLIAVMAWTGCRKAASALINKAPAGPPAAGQLIKYTIQKGNQYCDGNSYRPVQVTEMKFAVRFDSTAIYRTQLPENQYDINKLYGFSDNNADHHQYSARFGWRWSDNALRLFAYIYNEGTVSSRELTTVPIGSETSCSIKVSGSTYLFTVNGDTTSMPRSATTAKGAGYQLYPYFGGDETAPHQINIWIRDL